MAAYGFVAGLPLPLSGFTLRLWLSEGGVSLAVIGLTANIGLAYSLKFLWSPVLDNVPHPARSAISAAVEAGLPLSSPRSPHPPYCWRSPRLPACRSCP